MNESEERLPEKEDTPKQNITKVIRNVTPYKKFVLQSDEEEESEQLVIVEPKPQLEPSVVVEQAPVEEAEEVNEDHRMSHTSQSQYSSYSMTSDIRSEFHLPEGVDKTLIQALH